VTASGDKTAQLWGVWPLLTVAYAEIAALRAWSKDERASLLLTEADPDPGQEQVPRAATILARYATGWPVIIRSA
jgi:hypothetical protein